MKPYGDDWRHVVHLALSPSPPSRTGACHVEKTSEIHFNYLFNAQNRIENDRHKFVNVLKITRKKSKKIQLMYVYCICM